MDAIAMLSAFELSNEIRTMEEFRNDRRKKKLVGKDLLHHPLTITFNNLQDPQIPSHLKGQQHHRSATVAKICLTFIARTRPSKLRITHPAPAAPSTFKLASEFTLYHQNRGGDQRASLECPKRSSFYTPQSTELTPSESEKLGPKSIHISALSFLLVYFNFRFEAMAGEQVMPLPCPVLNQAKKEAFLSDSSTKALQPLNISVFQVPELDGDNYRLWKEKIILQLGWMDVDYAIRKDEPPALTDTSNKSEIDLYERWERSNRLSMMYIKSKISASIRGSLGVHKNVRDLLKAIDEQFESSEKALASTLMSKLSTMKLTSIKGVREHIMRMRDIAAQLKTLEVELPDSFLVYSILNSLPPQYGPFKISYNTHKQKWSINEVLTMCVQEEGRLFAEMGESAHLANQGKDKNQAKKKDVSSNTWWIDSGATIHISNTLQGFLNQRKPTSSEQYIYSGNKMGSLVEAIGTCKLILNSGFVLILDRTFYVPSFSRNLISISKLVPLGYSFEFSNNMFKLFFKSNIVGNGTMSDGLFRVQLQDNTSYDTMHASSSISIKRCATNENSSMLWHRRLGHISLERVKRLVKEGVLNALDFTDFNTCIDCIKGKQTNKTKKGAKRSSSLLEIIHTDICSPDMDSSNQKYFITFIDDYSRYMFLYLLNNKNEALDAFKVFKAEVEKQCDKQIKIVRSDKGGEYYGRYTEDGQAPGPFARFLQEHGITWNLDSENDHIETRTPTSSDRLVIINAPQVQTGIEKPIIEEPQSIDHDLVDPVVQQPQEPVIQPVEDDSDSTLRRSTRVRSVLFLFPSSMDTTNSFSAFYPNHPSPSSSIFLDVNGLPRASLPRQGPVINFNQNIIEERTTIWSKRIIAALINWKDMAQFRLQFILNNNWFLQGKVEKVAVWLRFTGVPMELICNRVAFLLGQMAGEVVQLDPINDKEDNIQCGRLGHLDRDCNWNVLKTFTELQNQRNNFFTKFGYAYWVDTQHVLFECPKRKTQEWSFRDTTLIQVEYSTSNVTFKVFEQFKGDPSLNIQFGIQNLNHDQRGSKGNMFPPAKNQENMEQGFQKIKQEQVEQGFLEKVNVVIEAKFENYPGATKGEVESVLFEDEKKWTDDFLARKEQPPGDDGFPSPPDYGYEDIIDDILEDFAKELPRDSETSGDPMDVEELNCHQIQCGIGPLVNLDYDESFNCGIQETDDRKNQEESQIPEGVVVELEFDDSINQVSSQLNFPTRVMDMLGERLRGWAEIISPEESSMHTYQMRTDFISQGEGLAMMVYSHDQGKLRWDISHMQLKRCQEGNRTRVGVKRQGNFPQNKKRKKLKVKRRVGEIRGIKRKTKGTEVVLEGLGMWLGTKRIKVAHKELRVKATWDSMQKMGTWEASPIRPPKEE
ncbi:Retrovirus-related Pol polyprotein from transposon TNT 1-94 [Senna tora]|uniref:Retrovirus-related Pol polyprotein from transposon TNT 1-94 n=1 Tax=Senna tora TaxID=362788 RepID=A0A835CEI9_9FABA|nr:Retrovirus-related Pol polyprotein from transposon TNT 1-94 [Senna tora]